MGADQTVLIEQNGHAVDEVEAKLLLLVTMQPNELVHMMCNETKVI